MSWRNIESEIQSDLEAEKLRIQKESMRSANISNGWQELWDGAISCLTANAEELDKKLQGARILSVGNNLSLVLRDENHYSFENPAFPLICLHIKCKPGNCITVSGTKEPSAFRSEKIHPLRFTFDVDMNYRPYIAGESRGCYSPARFADLLTDIAADFFREVATR
jgi:hypothetical protein